MTPSPVNAESFRRALGAVPAAVSVLTIVDEAGGDQGMTVSAFCSLSLNPPLVLACIGDDATLAPELRTVGHFALSVLAADQAALAKRFAHTDARRFEGIAHARGPLGTALLDGAAAHIECRIVARHPAGDHTIVVGEVHHAVAHDRPPLVYRHGDYATLKQ